jgi:hypothetical protein
MNIPPASSFSIGQESLLATDASAANWEPVTNSPALSKQNVDNL